MSDYSSDDSSRSAKNVVVLKEKLKEDVIFTRSGGGRPILLKASEVLKQSNEALAVWVVEGRAWKVFGTTKKHDDYKADYERAERDGPLPMGKFSFIKGKVKVGEARQKDGFVIESDKMEGTNFQKSADSFIVALKREHVSKNRNNPDYQKIREGCQAAVRVGLKDCQGFVKVGIPQPLRFIDVHTRWNKRKGQYDHSGRAAELVKAIEKWPDMR